MPEQLADVLGVARPHFQQVTVIPSDVVQLQNFRTLGEGVRDAVVAGSLLAANGDKGQHGLIKLMRVDQSCIALDDASALQLADSLEHGRRGKTHDPGDLSLGYSGVILKKIQYYGIYFVYHSVYSFLHRSYSTSLGIKPNVPLPSLAPPSTVRTSPVMKPDCGATKKVTASAISPGVPHLRRGTISVIRSMASGVLQSCLAAPADSTGPGATALTRMPWGAHSTASVCVIDKTSALAAAEWIVPGLPVPT